MGWDSERWSRPHIALAEYLQDAGYRFITPTPATHARVLKNGGGAQGALQDAFGWNRPFKRELLPPHVYAAVRQGDGPLTHIDGDLCVSQVRVSSLGDDLFMHSSFPTTDPNSVFFGPDTYRFADFIRAELPRLGPIKQLVDLGSGSGAGAIAAIRCAEIERVWFADINEKAFDMAQVNVHIANRRKRFAADTAHSTKSGLSHFETASVDVVIANPPYIADPLHRQYRDGGGLHGGAVSVDWANQAAEKLKPGGALLLYTGSAIVRGEDVLKSALAGAIQDRMDIVSYRELDPDVFGEELDREDYADVDRIAVVGLVAVKRRC